MAVRCIYVLAFLLAFQVDGIALDGPIEDAAHDLKKASEALNKELAEKPNVPPKIQAAKKLPLGVRECEKYPKACKDEDIAKAKLEKEMKEHPKRFKNMKVEDTKYDVKVIKTDTDSKKVESKVVANKLMTEKPDKTKKEESEKKVVVEVKAQPEPEKKTEPVKPEPVTAKPKPEKKAKQEKKNPDTWFDRTVLGVKLPIPKLPWQSAIASKASQAQAAAVGTKNVRTKAEVVAVAAKKTQFLQVSKGVEVTVLKAGDGIHFPKIGDTVTMHYTGLLTDSGKQFDSSVDRGQPFVTKIGVGQVIKGWDEGVVKMSLGEKATLTMTSDYGYGAAGAGGVIPPNAGLTFKVELLKIQSPDEAQ